MLVSVGIRYSIVEPGGACVLRRGREPRDLEGLRVDLADMALGELGHPEIVLGVGDDLVDPVGSARNLVGRMELLPLVAGEIEPEDVLGSDALGPYLAVDVVAQPDEVWLHAL